MNVGTGHSQNQKWFRTMTSELLSCPSRWGGGGRRWGSGGKERSKSKLPHTPKSENSPNHSTPSADSTRQIPKQTAQNTAPLVAVLSPHQSAALTFHQCHKGVCCPARLKFIESTISLSICNIDPQSQSFYLLVTDKSTSGDLPL